MKKSKEEIIGFLIGSTDILRMEEVNFTFKSRNKLADNIERDFRFI